MRIKLIQVSKCELYTLSKMLRFNRCDICLVHTRNVWDGSVQGLRRAVYRNICKRGAESQ